jgi:hypothetical protein
VNTVVGQGLALDVPIWWRDGDNTVGIRAS